MTTLSSLTFVAGGAGPYSLRGLDYLSTSHLSVTVNGMAVAATFNDATKTMTLAVSPAAGASVVVTRTTPRKREERLTQFSSLVTGQAGLRASLLNQDYRQNMLVGQEARDHLTTGTLPADALGIAVDQQNWDAESKRLELVGAAAEAGEVVTKAQLDVVDASARNLPTSVLDNDDGLLVVAGEWDDATPAAFRTALSLGSAALLASGTGANQVPVLTSDTPPRYPTVDGRNMDLAQNAVTTALNQRATATVAYLFASSLTANGIDPTVSTWSQNANTRVSSLLTPWNNRVELNNSSDIAFNTTPQFFTFSAGTWRIRYVARVRGPAGTFSPWAFRITDNDDTSSQTVYYDSGVQHVLKQPSGSQIFTVFGDEIILSGSSSFNRVFRWAEDNNLSNAMHLRLFFHKVSSSTP